jgi:hypothetical protein
VVDMGDNREVADARQGYGFCSAHGALSNTARDRREVQLRSCWRPKS